MIAAREVNAQELPVGKATIMNGYLVTSLGPYQPRTFAVKLAKLMGAGTVIGTASNADKLDLVRRLGADAAINYTEPNWVEQVKNATGGQGADINLEMVGGIVLGCHRAHWIAGSARTAGRASLICHRVARLGCCPQG